MIERFSGSASRVGETQLSRITARHMGGTLHQRGQLIIRRADKSTVILLVMGLPLSPMTNVKRAGNRPSTIITADLDNLTRLTAGLKIQIAMVMAGLEKPTHLVRIPLVTLPYAKPTSCRIDVAVATR